MMPYKHASCELHLCHAVGRTSQNGKATPQLPVYYRTATHVGAWTDLGQYYMANLCGFVLSILLQSSGPQTLRSIVYRPQ